MNKVKGLVHDLLGRGTAGVADSGRRQQVVFLNRALYLLIITSLPYPPYFIFLADWMLLASWCFMIGGAGTSLWLNGQGQLGAARRGLMVALLITATTVCLYLGRTIDSWSIFFALCIMPMLIFPVQESREVKLWTAVSCGCFLATWMFQLLIPEGFLPPMEKSETLRFNHIILALNFLLYALALMAAYHQSFRQFSQIKDMLARKEQLVKELHQQKEALAVARDRAELAGKAKMQFLSTMSHEVRTPLNAVIGMSSLLSETVLEEEQMGFVLNIKRSSNHLLTLFNDILDYAQLDEESLEVNEAAFELAGPIEDVFELMGAYARQKDVELIYQVEDNVPLAISSDLNRLRQILTQLVRNAIKFTEEGDVLVTVSQVEGPEQAREGDELRLCFSVRDTGIGIEAEKLKELFQPFFQVDSSNRRKYEGTGMGLALTNRLVTSLKGFLSVDSEFGEGSTFSFVLPVRAAAPLPKRPDGPDELLNGKQVLIVDDNETNLAILRWQCEKWGLVPYATSQPVESLQLVSQLKHLDLIILDMVMPGLDGVQLARKLKQHPRGKHLPLMMLSSIGRLPTSDDRDLFDAFLTKPARQSHLLEEVRRTLNGQAEPELPGRTLDGEAERISRHNKPLRVLLVEDNRINQKVASKMLEKLSYRVDIADNGKEGVHAAKMLRYDLILMDIQMPEMDGLDATALILKHYEHNARRPRIIAMTANTLQEDRKRCLEAGMDDFIPKPIHIHALDEVIYKWFYEEEL